MSAIGRRRSLRRGAPPAMQEALFEVEVRPERRYYRQILDALRRSNFGADALDSELIISRLFGTVWAGQVGQRDGSTEELFGLSLVDFARGQRTPTSVAVLRTVAAIAPIREVRDAATLAADALTKSGLPEPNWTPPLGALLAGRCWAYEDVFGDQSTVVCEFGYSDGPSGADLRTAQRHALVVLVDHAMHSVAIDTMLAPDVDPLIRDLRNDAKNSGPMFTLRQVDAEWAHAVLARGFARTDLIEGVDVEPTFADLRALALARVGALPDDPGALPPAADRPTPQECRALADEFLASPEAQELADPSSADDVVGHILEYACLYDPGQVARVSPAKWDTFAVVWLPKLSVTERTALSDVARAWSRWGVRRMSLPGVARDELAAALDEILDDYVLASPLGQPAGRAGTS